MADDLLHGFLHAVKLPQLDGNLQSSAGKFAAFWGRTRNVVRHPPNSMYEAHGLIRAERTAAGWRVYGPDQIWRLHQVIALKSFGFSLSRIAELLAGSLPDIGAFLELHEQVLRQEAKRVDKALRLLSAARAKLAQQGGLSSDELMNLTKETAMTDKRNDDLSAAYEAIAAKYFSSAARL